MNFLSPVFLTMICVGPIFLILGLIMQNKPPKKINNWYGYRTRNSMKSQKRWDFAQKYSATAMIRGGMLLCLFSIPGLFYSLGTIIDTILSIVIMLFVILVIVYRTEKELNKFPD